MHKLHSLKAWTTARDLARAAYKLTMSGRLSSHYALADQLRRAAISIPANIAEGYGLGTRMQLIRCIRIALGSAYELKCHLDLAAYVELVSAAKAATLDEQCNAVIRLLIGLLKRLRATVPR